VRVARTSRDARRRQASGRVRVGLAVLLGPALAIPAAAADEAAPAAPSGAVDEAAPAASAGAVDEAAPAASAGAVDEAEVLACMKENLPKDSSVQDLALRMRDRGGSEREILATLTWKRFGDRARALVRVDAPDDLRDAAVLLIERSDGGADLFSYLPEMAKVRRINSQTLQGRLFGSDFTYEDFQLLHGMALEGEPEPPRETELDGRPVWVLAREPGPEAGSAYERVVTYVDRATCLLRRAEMYESGERLRKLLVVDPEAVFEQDGVRLPRRIELEDRKRGSATALELIRVDLDKRVRRNDLDVSALER
jgi:hypothetical protein